MIIPVIGILHQASEKLSVYRYNCDECVRLHWSLLSAAYETIVACRSSGGAADYCYCRFRYKQAASPKLSSANQHSHFAHLYSPNVRRQCYKAQILLYSNFQTENKYESNMVRGDRVRSGEYPR